MSESPSITEVALYFSALSLMAIGGASAVIPDMYRHMVEVKAWMGADDFAALVALAQAAPGPNVLIVALLGWKVGGVPGGLVAMVGMCLPSSVLTYHFAGVWQRLEGSRIRATAQATLVPVTIGLILASAYLLAKTADQSPLAYLTTACIAGLVVKTDAHPLLLLAAAGVMGALGWF